MTDRDEIWEHGLEAFGETPSDVYGKQVEIPHYPQFLGLMVHGERNPIGTIFISTCFKIFFFILQDSWPSFAREYHLRNPS